MTSLATLMNMKGRAALITGGAGHLGSALAAALAELGANIILLDNNRPALEKKKARLTKEFKGRVSVVCVDLEDEPAVRQVPAMIKKEYPRLDVLVHCAALVGTSGLAGWSVPFDQQSSETWRRALEVNLTSVFVLTQACQSLLRRSRHASVINIASIYGLVGPDMSLYEKTGMGNPAAYAASKGGLLQLTRWLASNLSPEIRVNAVTPGGIWRNHKDPFLSKYVRKTLLGRMAREEDFKGAVAYLASDLSRYVTGHNLVVDGGWTVC